MPPRLLPLLAIFALSACQPGGDNEWVRSEVITLEASFYGAEALISVAQDDESLGSMAFDGSSTALRFSDQSPLLAMTDGGLEAALAAYSPYNGENAAMRLPRLSFVAVSPIGDVFLAFEHSFIFRETDDDGVDIAGYSDPWSPSSPYTCQLFVADKKIHEFTAADRENPPGFTCVTHQLELNVWDSRASMIQFDDAGNAYFSAHVPGNWKNVLIRFDATDTSLAEVINANICYRDFLITGGGGILYTGITSTDGECNGDSFLRYRTPSGELQEITQGWWDYRFAPIERGEHAGEILFYGPDPRQAAVPDWNDACLYRFNPEASGDSRATQLVDCEIDIWSYVEFAETSEEKHDRCLESRPLLGGGNQPQRIFLSDSYTRDPTTGDLSYGGGDDVDEVYVVSDVYHKVAGEWRCNICVEPDSSDPTQGHCVDGVGQLTTDTVEAVCLSAGNTWFDEFQPNCFNDSTGAICAASLPGHFRKYGEWCQSPGNDWLETFSGLARVESAAATTGSVAMLSSVDEVVTNAWSLDDRLVYSSFNAPLGRYELREVDGDSSRLLLDGIEVYELIVDPRDDSRWFLNGLRFSDNAYIIGTLDPSTGELDVETGVTGQIETIVIIPDP